MRDLRLSRSTADERRSRVVAVVGLTAFVLGVYVVVVVGGGALLGRTASPSVPLSVVATVIVALGFEPARGWTASVARRRFGTSGSSAYDVLSHFSETVTGGYATEELPDRMVRLLAEGTHAEWAQVWLTVQGRLRLVASWPPDAGAVDEVPEPAADARDLSGDGRRAIRVRHGGHVYGVFRLQERAGVPLSSVEERLFAGLASQAGLVLRLVGLRADLAARHEERAARAAELQLSRERVIAAQDDERRRLERDIHDGAQQHLVALAVNLRLVETIAAKDPDRAARVLAAQTAAAHEATETLSRLVRGLYPRLLAEEGLAAALAAALAGTDLPVTVVDDAARRLPDEAEVALYFFAMEAIQNAAKHAGATGIVVRLESTDDGVRVTVADDGHGFRTDARTSDSGGAGLANMRDRIDAVGGTVAVESAPGRGTRVTATVPLREPALAG